GHGNSLVDAMDSLSDPALRILAQWSEPVAGDPQLRKGLRVRAPAHAVRENDRLGVCPADGVPDRLEPRTVHGSRDRQCMRGELELDLVADEPGQGCLELVRIPGRAPDVDLRR